MKKILAFALSALCLLPLISCGGTVEEGSGAAAETTAPEATTTARPYLDNLPDDLDLNGASYRVLWYTTNDYADETKGEVVNDALFERNLSVESRLNCKVVNVNEPFVWANREEYLNKVRACVLTNDGAYDVTSGKYNVFSGLVAEGLFCDLAARKSLDFTQSYWVRQLIEETTIGGKLYLSSGDITTNKTNSIMCLLYNRTLLENMKLPDPTEIVREGKWTMDALNTMINNVYADTNGNGKKDLQDRFGISVLNGNNTKPFIQSFNMGITTLNKDGYPELTFNTERVVNGAQAVNRLLLENPNTLYGGNTGTDFAEADIITNFIEGKSLILTAEFSYFKQVIDMPDTLGILPYPKYDEKQADYGSALSEENTLFGILVTAKDKDGCAAVMEALASEGQRLVTPALYEITLKTRYATDPVFADMLDLISNSVIFNFGSVYGYTLNSISTFFKETVSRANMNWASEYAKKEAATLKAIDDYLAKVKALEQ